MDETYRGPTLAYKRIPVTESTWKTLHELKNPGQTYDSLLIEIISVFQRHNLEIDLDALGNSGEFVPLSEAKLKLGLPDGVSK